MTPALHNRPAGSAKQDLASARAFMLTRGVSVQNCSPRLLHCVASLSRVLHLHIFTHTLSHLARQLGKCLYSDVNICLTGIQVQIWHETCSPEVSRRVSVCSRSAASLRRPSFLIHLAASVQHVHVGLSMEIKTVQRKQTR